MNTQEKIIDIEAILSAEAMITVFKQDFKVRYGVFPDVYYSLRPGKAETKLALDEIFNITNEVYMKHNPDVIDGIKNKSRNRNLVLYRQAYFKIACDTNYTLARIGDLINRDHSTVIHGAKTINKLLSTGKYPDVEKIYNEIYETIKIRISIKRHAELVSKIPTLAQSVLSANLHKRSVRPY